MNSFLSFCIIGLILASAVSPVYADQIDQLILQGQEQVYNARFDDAARLFDQAIAIDKTDPRGYFFRANVHLWSYLFDNRKEQFTQFMSLSDQAMKVAQDRVSNYPQDSRARLFLGISYGYRAIAHARAENFTAAALSAKTCYDKLNEVVRVDPKQYDAYLGLGLFHFMFGSIPRVGQLMVGLTGIKGDAPLGVREIQAAAARGVYFRNDAQLIAGMLDIYYNGKSDDGLRALGAMANRYPHNPAIQYVIGAIQLNRRQASAALPYFENVIRISDQDFRAFTTLSYVQCGKIYYSMNNFPRAKAYFQKFLKNSQERTYRTLAWYMLGVCYEMENDRTNAVKAYDRAAQSGNFSSPDDRSGSRRAAILLKSPLSDNDRNALRAVNAVYANNLAEAERYANLTLAGSGLTAAQKAQAYYALGMSLYCKNVPDCNGAIQQFNRALACGEHNETWVAPNCYFMLAECYKSLKNKDLWQKNIDRAKDYHGYDNEVELRFKMERDVTKID